MQLEILLSHACCLLAIIRVPLFKELRTSLVTFLELAVPEGSNTRPKGAKPLFSLATRLAPPVA